MSAFAKKLAENKFFVPVLIFLMFLMVVSSFAEKKEEAQELSLEKQLEEMCNTIYGVKNAKVMISYEAVTASSVFDGNSKAAKIKGIAIVCEGGSDPTVQLSLHRMLKALFGVSTTQITVSERKPFSLS